MAAVDMGAFSETLITFHPGVITMWIAALRTFFTEPHISVQGLALARWLIGIALLSGIGVAAVLLYRLFGRWVAIIGTTFLSFFPILEILAAVGLFEFLKWGYSYIDSRFGAETNSQKLTFSIVTLLCLFLIQILPVLRLHPYYGTYYNLCFKLTDIRKIITVGAGAGCDLAAKYLNRKPYAQELRVQTLPQSAQFFVPYFVG